MTFSNFDQPSAELFLKLGILPIDKLYNLNISILMYKTHNKLITGKYNLTQVSEIHQYNTRSAKNKNYYYPFNKLNIGLNTFSAKGSKIWSQIQYETKQLPLHIFKNQIKTNLLNLLKS